MKKLNLPIIKEELPRASNLSMDDYLKFVMFMKRAFGKRVNKKNTRFLPSRIAFHL